MWETSFWNKYTKNLRYYNLILDHCMFGGQRLKRTRISHCIPALQHLAFLCDGQDTHLPWGQANGKWAASEETAFPVGLCDAMVQQFLQQMKSFRVIPPPMSMKDVTNHDDVAFARAFGGKQPRGKRSPPLVSEFESIIESVGPKRDMPPDRIKSDWLIPATVSSNTATISLRSSESVAIDRTSAMRRWMSELVACMDEEKSYKEDMSPHRAKILASKRLVLFRRMLVEAKHDDEKLVDNIRHGFDLVGEIPSSGVYKKRVKPASITADELRRAAKRTRKAIIQSTRGSDDPAVDLGVYQSTLDEMDRGWLHDPYTEQELGPAR